MQSVKNSIGVLVLLLTVGVAVTVVSPQPARGAGSAPVTVVNTAGNPVPVVGTVNGQITGDVNVTNSPTVKAQQSGPWTVSVANDGSSLPVSVAGSHLSRPVSDHVMLTGGSQGLQRLLPNGTTTPFVIPDGMVLVVTDVEWRSAFLVSGNTADPDEGDTAHLVGMLRSSGGATHDAFRSSGFVGAEGIAAGSDHFTAGIFIASDAQLVFRLDQGFGTADNQAFAATLQGYLMPE